MLSEEKTVQAKYKTILKKLALKSRNCFDCGAKNPNWGDIHFGLFVCFPCAGKHRSMGTHISFVRSTTFDGWSASNLKRMVAGGNTKAKEYFSKYGMRINKCKSHTEFYDGKIARRYKEILEREAQKVDLDVITPKLTPTYNFFALGLDDMIEDLPTTKAGNNVPTVKESEKSTETKSAITHGSEETNEMARFFNNMVVSSSKQKKPSPNRTKKSPEYMSTKPKRFARIVSVAHDDSASDDDFEAEMEKAKSRKKPLFPSEPVTKEKDEFVKSFASSKSMSKKKEIVESKKIGSSEVKAVFENKYGKTRGNKYMTSISSSDFQKDEGTKQMQLSQFQGATSIGSDAFFGREARENDEEIQWDEVRDEAVNKAKQLSEAAASWFSSVKDSLK